MNLGDNEILGNLLPGNVASTRGVHGNNSGTEGGASSSVPATRRLVNSCEGLNVTPSGTQQMNFAAFPPSLQSCESEDRNDSQSSNNGRPDLCSTLDSLRSPHQNNVYRSLRLTSCKSPAENFWRKCFGCLSPPEEDRVEESPNVDIESFSASGINTAEETPKNQISLVDGNHSVPHSNETVPDIALNNSKCNYPLKSKEHELGDDSRENVLIEVDAISVFSSSEIAVHPDKNLYVDSLARSARVGLSNSYSAQLSLTSERVKGESFGDCSEAPLLRTILAKNSQYKIDIDYSSSDRSGSNYKNYTLLESRNGSYNWKSAGHKIVSVEGVTTQNTNFVSEATDLPNSNRAELNFVLVNDSYFSEESNFIADGAEEGSLFSLPIKFSNAQIKGDQSAGIKLLLSNDVSSSDKMTLKRSPSLVESFSEPSQHFNMSAVHKDIKLMRLKSDELPSFHSPSSPTLFRVHGASTKTSTPLRGCRSILAISRLKNTPSPPVTPIRSRRAVETPLEYPLERLVKKDKASKVREQGSSLCPNMSYVNPDHSNMYSPGPCSVYNLTSQSVSDDSGDIEEFELNGSVIRKINFSEEYLEEKGRQRTHSEPWLQTLLSRTLDCTELKMCALACQMAWELQEKVYSEIYERLSHMETDDEHYRIEETSRYKCIYVDKIERLWHFIVPLLEQKYWNRRSLKVVNKNLFIYGNRRLNAKQWEFANYNNCVFDVQCVFDYGLYAFDTSNPVFQQDNIRKFLAPKYNPEVSSEEVYK